VIRRWRAAVGVIALATGAVAVPQAARAADAPCLQTVAGIDLTTATIPQLSQAMAAGRLTSAQLVDAYVARIRAYDLARIPRPPNSIRYLNPNARVQAAALDGERRAGHVRGPLHGIPVLLKDNVGTADQPTTAGSIALEHNIPKRDATLTARLRAAGAVILGKANMAEFANWMSLNMPNGYSSLGGQVLSAYDGSNPSGSSSGSGVAMSMAFAAATIGSETAGSIIGPAGVGGDVGVKPTIGAVSRAGVIPLAESWDTAGPITHSVVDAAIVMNAIAGEDPSDPVTVGVKKPDFMAKLGPDALKGARIGWDPNGPVDDVFTQALADMKAKGATLVEIPTFWPAYAAAATELTGIFNQFKYGINQYLTNEAGPGLPVKSLTDIILFNQQHKDKVKYGQNLLVDSDLTPGLHDLGVAQAAVTINAEQTLLEATFSQYDLDAIAGPSPFYAYHEASAQWTSVVVPAGMAAGVPEGLQLIGRPFSEPTLLGYASAFEPVGRARVPSPTAVNKALVAAACPAAAAAATGTAPSAQVKAAVLATTGRESRAALLVAFALVAVVLPLRRVRLG
jgi:amidase